MCAVCAKPRRSLTATPSPPTHRRAPVHFGRPHTETDGMSRSRSILICTLVATFALLGAQPTDPAICQDRDLVLQRIFYSPWPPLEYTWPPGGVPQLPTTVSLPPRGSLTERDTLEYFTVSEEAVPTVSSKVTFGNREPGFRASLRRTWQFPGLRIEALVSLNGGVYYTSIALETRRYPLICGLGIGVPQEKFLSLLGSPLSVVDSSSQRSGRTLVYEDAGDAADLTDFKIMIDVGASGSVHRIRWHMPLTH